MLTIADVQRALDEAPELRYVDDSWRIYKSYYLVEGESGLYVCAADVLPAENPLGTGLAYAANEIYDAEPEDELRERLVEYFLTKYRGSADKEMNDFLVEFLRRSDDAVDEKGKKGLRKWLRKEHEELDETLVGWLYDLSAEAFDVDEIVAEGLYDLYRRADEAFRIGGQEGLFKCLREEYEGVVGRQTLEQLLADMREDFGRGAGIVEALGRAVHIDKSGVAVPGPFTRKVLFNVKQDALRQVRAELDGSLKLARSRPRAYYPLSSPGLFLEFANLGEQEIDEGVVLEWVHRYGILGLRLREHVGDVHFEGRGGPWETVAAFAREAEEANWVKRVCEAAFLLDSADDEIVEGAMQGLRELFGWSTCHQLSLQECQEKALEEVRLGVQYHLDHDCQVRWRRAGNGLIEFLEPKNVLGAMYLQLAWVLRERATIRRCKYCGKPVEGVLDTEEKKARKTHKNKRLCSRDCNNAHNYERRRKKHTEASLNFSVPRATREEVETLAATRGMDVDALFQEMLRVYREHNNQAREHNDQAK